MNVAKWSTRRDIIGRNSEASFPREKQLFALPVSYYVICVYSIFMTLYQLLVLIVNYYLTTVYVTTVYVTTVYVTICNQLTSLSSIRRSSPLGLQMDEVTPWST